MVDLLTYIWKDRWFLKPNFLVRPRLESDFSDNNRVKILFNKEDGCWIKEVIKEVLGEEKLEGVCKLSFNRLGMEDKLIWEASPNGRLSIRNAYFLEVNNKRRDRGNSSGITMNDLVWKCLWKLNIPNSVKIFMWKALGESLPTNKNLFMYI